TVWPGSLYIARCQIRDATCASRWSRPYASTRTCPVTVCASVAVPSSCTSRTVASGTVSREATSSAGWETRSTSAPRTPGGAGRARDHRDHHRGRVPDEQAADDGRRQRGAEVHRRERDCEHDEAAESSERPHQVQRERDEQRGRDRDVDGGERRAVAHAHGDP